MEGTTGDRDRWALDEGFAILAYRFRIRTTSGACAALIARIFGDCASAETTADGASLYELEPATPERPAQLRRDGRPLMLSGEASLAVALLAWHVMRDAVFSTSSAVVVHAGAVVAPQGGAIVLPAASGSGKTTLVAGLVRAGCAFLSDEIAAFDPATGSVLPVPRALSMKPGTLEALGMPPPRVSAEEAEITDGLWVRAADLSERPIGSPAQLRTVVVPAYVAGGPTELTPISRAAGLIELARHGFNAEEFGRRETILLLGRVLPGARCYRLAVGSLDEAVAAVLEAASR